jgi:hypothetical protein
VLAAVLDDEHPVVGIVDQLVPKRKFRRFLQSRVALLFNQVRSVREMPAESDSPRRPSSCKRLATGLPRPCPGQGPMFDPETVRIRR